MAQNTLPLQAFDGQLFIDAFRVKWQFDGKVKCWRNIGTCPEIPIATELQPGLLSAKLKRILDGIPVGGGHFGIIAQPLLTLKKDPRALVKDQVNQVNQVQSGTRIQGKVIDSRRYAPEQFVGKILMFLSGTLAKKVFLIFTNDEDFLYLEGDATAAKVGDRYQIVESSAFNPSGVLLGDIMLVSDSIDITCVDGQGLPIGAACNVVQCDAVENPPGLNFQVNKDLLDSLCVTVPGCKGTVGNRGAKGVDGADGTGDGPTGEQGDPGENAPTIANTFTGVKIVDIDDIYDTAVVAMELDAEAGKLNVIRAKVRTPDNDIPATQVISTPIDRSVEFTGSTSFDYTLMKPSVDPIGQADIDILKYPSQFTQENHGQETNINRVKLSEIVDAIIDHYQGKLTEINNQYNQDLKAYIEEKDAKARELLADLAQRVADCEFELPIEFCLGIQPDECHPDHIHGEEPFEFPFADVLFGSTDGEIKSAVPLGETVVPPIGSQVSITFPKTEVSDEFKMGASSLTDIISELPKSEEGQTMDLSVGPFPQYLGAPSGQGVDLPAGNYVIQYVGGAYKAESGFLVGNGGNPEAGQPIKDVLGAENRSRHAEGSLVDVPEGLTIIAEDKETGLFSVVSFPAPNQPHNANEPESVEAAYNLSSEDRRAIGVALPKGGRISLLAIVLPSEAVAAEIAAVPCAKIPDGIQIFDGDGPGIAAFSVVAGSPDPNSGGGGITFLGGAAVAAAKAAVAKCGTFIDVRDAAAHAARGLAPPEFEVPGCSGVPCIEESPSPSSLSGVTPPVSVQGAVKLRIDQVNIC